MINSRDIDELEPVTQLKCRQFVNKCAEAGIDVIITSTYRDYESQDALYAKGRTAPGKIVTNAQAGQSFHNFRVAFDFVPVVDGKAQWDDTLLWGLCGKIAVNCGLEWGGNFKSFKDRPHCQYTGGRDLKYFRDLNQSKVSPK